MTFEHLSFHGSRRYRNGAQRGRSWEATNGLYRVREVSTNDGPSTFRAERREWDNDSLVWREIHQHASRRKAIAACQKHWRKAYRTSGVTHVDPA